MPIGRFQSTSSVTVFFSQSVVDMIMIDGSKICKLLVGFQGQSLHVIERCSQKVKRYLSCWLSN